MTLGLTSHLAGEPEPDLLNDWKAEQGVMGHLQFLNRAEVRGFEVGQKRT
jgi:hypothetical protein